MKILVTGSNGQLGSELRDVSNIDSKYEFIFADRSVLDLSDLDRISDYLSKIQPDLIVNAAAYTAVDKAESEKEIASTINFLAIAKMSEWAVVNNAKIIHISTDYVFDGESNQPLKESDKTNPVNHYGKTKYDGEQALQNSGANYIIIRTSWVYSTYGANFVKTMLRLMSEREEISVVSDQIGSPTYARDLAKAIVQIIQSDVFEKGIYHYSNEGEISWFDFAIAIKSVSEKDCVIHSISTKSYPTPAKRPRYSLLDKSKIKSTFAIEIPNWKDSLVHMLSKLDAK